MQDLNQHLSNLPFVWHLIASSIIIIMYSHAWIGFLKIKSTLPATTRVYLWVTLLLMTFYFCNRYSDPDKVLDAYYLRWWIFYTHTLFIMKGHAIERSRNFKQLWHSLFKFDTPQVKPH